MKTRNSSIVIPCPIQFSGTWVMRYSYRTVQQEICLEQVMGCAGRQALLARCLPPHTQPLNELPLARLSAGVKGITLKSWNTAKFSGLRTSLRAHQLSDLTTAGELSQEDGRSLRSSLTPQHDTNLVHLKRVTIVMTTQNVLELNDDSLSRNPFWHRSIPLCHATFDTSFCQKGHVTAGAAGGSVRDGLRVNEHSSAIRTCSDPSTSYSNESDSTF